VNFFFGFFTLAYAGANLYALSRFRRAFGLSWRSIVPFVPLFLPLVFAPPLVHLLERQGTLPAAMVAAWVGYGWLGMLFLFCWMHAAADLGVFLVRKVRNYPGRTLPLDRQAARRTFLAVSAVVLASTGYSFYEAVAIRPEHVTVETDRLPPGRDRVRIAQISDLHVGMVVQAADMRRVADIVRAEKPDLLVATGDLVDAGFIATGKLPDIFRALDPPLGKYAITGNHEYYAGLARSILFIERSGFRLLRNEATTLREPGSELDPAEPCTPFAEGGPGSRIGQVHDSGLSGREAIRVVGVDDEAGMRFGGPQDNPETKMFEGARSPLFTLYLKHRPLVTPESAGKFDLQLSGHTHRGQLYPFRWLVALRFPYIAGLYDLPGGGRLYTSRGTGTWGPRMRFLTPPEVTIIDVVRRKAG
jgi:predicted MPP superfamily phosphohydrolase